MLILATFFPTSDLPAGNFDFMGVSCTAQCLCNSNNNSFTFVYKLLAPRKSRFKANVSKIIISKQIAGRSLKDSFNN